MPGRADLEVSTKMAGQQKIRLPVWAIVLDVIGALLLALGIFGLVGGQTLPLPAFLDVRALSIVIIFAGVLLMLPMIVIIIRQAAR